MFLYRMARCGVQTLLCKYKNPILQSARILINKRSYYHLYKMMYSDGCSEYRGSKDVIILKNITTIGDIRLDLIRDFQHLMYCYRGEHTITFTRANDDSICISIVIHQNDETCTTWINRRNSNRKFKVSGDAEFLTVFDDLAGNIVETTLAEIYRNHLPTILHLLKV